MDNFILTAFSVTSLLLLLPLLILVFCEGHQRWRKQRSIATATAMTSHCDFFTYNMVAMELISLVAVWLCCCGGYTVQTVMMVGQYMLSISTPGKTLFHILTCVERYLAVVHPITYLRLRQAGGVRIRNISTGCVWLMCFVGTGLTQEFFIHSSSVFLYFWAISLITVSFCSFSVLHVLIRPRPGDGGGDRERVDQSKQRAFNTIMAIMGALLLRFVGYLVGNAAYNLSVLSVNEKCAVVISVVWFSLPSSLVLPLLFLHRAGKLPTCKQNPESG